MQLHRGTHDDAKLNLAGESHGGLNYHHFSKIGRRSLTGSRARRVRKSQCRLHSFQCYLFFLLIAFFFERAAMPAGQTSFTRHPPPLPCPSLILLRLMRMQG